MSSAVKPLKIKMETNNRSFEILYRDDDLVAIDKPSGFHVHPPENSPVKVPRHKICLSLLRDQIGCYLYPLHRIDVATSGVLLWALNQETAGLLNQAFRTQQVKKTYQAVVRGFTGDEFAVDLPLELDSTHDLVPARTEFKKLGQIEIQAAVGKKFPTARYTWLKASPQTGRYHQIRRHLNRISNPILGDTDHGDSHHNRFFREKMGISGLCLRAFEIEFPHPRKAEMIKVTAPIDRKWQKISELFNSADA